MALLVASAVLAGLIVASRQSAAPPPSSVSAPPSAVPFTVAADADTDDAGEGAARDAGRADSGPPTWVRIDPRSEALCPPNMLLVDGSYCPYVGHRCKQWISEGGDRCQRYSENEICEGRIRTLRFCIDRFEYPNIQGVLPVVMVDWTEARDACRAEGKRLCTESEWNFACEGEARMPYPYGYERDATACNIDRVTALPDFRAFDVDREVSEEVGRLDQRVRSGSLPRCVSPFGVYDTTGNVDEWVVNERGEPDVSGLKGGYFGKVRARCRPMTTFHNRWFRFYQVGFRCCSDPLAQPKRRRGSDAG